MNTPSYSYVLDNTTYYPDALPHSNPAGIRYTIRAISLNNRLLNIHDKQYQIKREIGKGSFGEVYSARSLPGSAEVAIKVVSLVSLDNSEAMGLAESILTEIRMTKKLQHSSNHIIKMFDFDFHPHTGLAFIVMERGLHDLEKELLSRGRLSSMERKMVWRQLVDMAVALDRYGIVHLDIKPENILMFPNNQLKLIDLGIAKQADSRRGGSRGTWYYSAPEVVRATNNPAAINTSVSDAWSWAAILYRIVYLTPPTYKQPCHHPPRGMSTAKDSQLVDLLRRTLVIDPAQRLGPRDLAAHPYTVSNAPHQQVIPPQKHLVGHTMHRWW